MNNSLIRQGWLRVLIFLIVWVMLQLGINRVLYSLVKPFAQNASQQTDPGLNLLIIALSGFVTSVPAVLIFRKLIDRQTIASLGFNWGKNGQHAWSGFFSALFILSAGSLMLVASGNLSFIGFDFSPEDLMLYVLVMLLVAFAEEMVIRGYILNNLLESFPKWLALLISATLFALFHFLNPAFSWLGLLGIFIGGLLIGLNYIYTKNLWFGIFFHFAWNYFQGPIFGFKVSGLETDSLLVQNIKGPVWWTGGPFGFEASLLAFLLIIVVAIYLGIYYKSNEQVLARQIV